MHMHAVKAACLLLQHTIIHVYIMQLVHAVFEFLAALCLQPIIQNITVTRMQSVTQVTCGACWRGR